MGGPPLLMSSHLRKVTLLLLMVTVSHGQDTPLASETDLADRRVATAQQGANGNKS